MEQHDARAALDAVKDTDLRMAERMRWPLWRHAAYGILLAALLAAFPLDNLGRMIAFGFVLAAVMGIVIDDKKRHGLFVSGFQGGGTGWIIGLNAALFLAAVIAMHALVTKPLAELLYWMLVAGMFLVSTGLSLLWQKVYQGHLRGMDR